MVRAWRGIAIGLCVGGTLGIVWSILDFTGKFYTEWSWLGLLALAASAIGGIWGFVLRVPDEALSASIDRRANLEDRLTSAREYAQNASFGEPLVNDAASHFEKLRPARVFPLKVGRWQAGALTLSVLAAGIFLLGNTPLLLNEDQKKQLEQLKAEGSKVERIIRENLEDPNLKSKMTEKDRKLADELMKLKRDLDKGRLKKEDALQRANEIAKQAEELMREHNLNREDSLKSAESAMDKLRKQAMEQVGMKNADPNLMKMSDQQREDMMHQLEQQMSTLQNQMNAMQTQMMALQQQLKNPNLSEEERKKLEAQMKALQEAMTKAQQDMKNAADQYQSLKLSKEAQEVFQKMTNHPLYKKLQELAQKMAEDQQQMAKTGQPKLTKEELERLQKELEELARQLKDDKAMEEYLQALIDAMKEGNAACQSAGVCALHPRPPMPGRGAPTEDVWTGDNGMINKLDKEQAGGGKTNSTMISGQKREMPTQDAYVEIKAPTTVGNRSSIPYVKVLPSYKKKAESALDRQEIPKQHEKRVKEYFESLNGK
jgi:hypothetical protein